MSARDELLDILDRFHLPGPRRQCTEILAAGYRKPRTITTVSELDALPGGAVIRDNDGDVFEAVRCTGDEGAGVPDYNCWDQIAETWPLDSDKIVLPATVLDEADQ